MKRIYSCPQLIFVPCLLLSFNLSAMDDAGDKPAETTDPLPVQDNSTEVIAVPEESWYDKTNFYLSDKVYDFSTYIDHSLAKEEDEEPIANRSYLRIKTKDGYSHRGYFQSDPKVTIRVDLPHVKRNWKLILETDPDDYNSLESKQRDTISGDTDGHTSSAIGGFRLQDDAFTHWKTNFDIGVKIKIPFDPFTRADIHRVDKLDYGWTSRMKEQIFYYHSKGSGFLSELDFYHLIDDDTAKIIKFGASAQYLYEDDNWELLFQPTVYHRLNEKHLMEYSVGISAEPYQKDEVSNYWVSASWRQNIYKSWLYLYVTPQINAPREYDYKLNPGILLQFEAIFSKKRSINRLNRSIPAPTRNKD